MELEKQVCSLELAKRLKELGVKQESAFYWENVQKSNWVLSPHSVMMESVYDGEDGWPILSEALHRENAYSAFTVAELGEMLKGKGMGTTAHSSMMGDEWWVTGGNWIVEKQKYSHIETAVNWADALAKMLIYLVENKFIHIA